MNEHGGIIMSENS